MTKNNTENYTKNNEHSNSLSIDNHVKNPILEADNLKLWFPLYRGLLRKTVGYIRAVNGVSFKLEHGKTLGIVGESGCGKTSLGKALMRLYEPSFGTLKLLGKDITHIKQKHFRKDRKNIQMIFQDPIESLNERMTVGDNLKEPFFIQKIKLPLDEINLKIKNFLKQVGINENAMNRYPHEFSGGQCQRIVIAKAMLLNPKILICDEPVSALDVSIQSQVINILLNLQQELKLSYVFISHDLTVVRHVSDKVIVMYLGEVVEYASSINMYDNPLHPYTQALIKALPVIDTSDSNSNKTSKTTLKGELPSPINPPSGCKFHTRCPYVKDICKTKKPEFKLIKQSNSSNQDDYHYVACHLIKDINTKLDAQT